MQVPLQMSTAAYARQGRMGRDQVRDLLFGGLHPSSLFVDMGSRVTNRSAFQSEILS